jgi:hypothetical protein
MVPWHAACFLHKLNLNSGKGEAMILATLLVASSLIVPVAVVPDGLPPLDRGVQMSMAQKQAAMRSLMNSATECIARNVSANPRFRQLTSAGDVNDLIVDSMPSCAGTVRAMIDAYDRLFGEGAGEKFFMGPYLDNLPRAVDRLTKDAE